jgi:hypothetical protein
MYGVTGGGGGGSGGGGGIRGGHKDSLADFFHYVYPGCWVGGWVGRFRNN